MSSSPSHASVANYTNSSNAVTIIKGQKCLNKPDSRWGGFLAPLQTATGFHFTEIFP